MANNSNNENSQGFSLLNTKEAILKRANDLKISNNLRLTLVIGLFAGILSTVGYSLSLPIGGPKILFLFILLAAASYISGFFLGFLFGIPKRNNNNNNESDYLLNNNLVDISDWLTKIIIGLGLIEIKRIPGYLESIGIYIQRTVDGENSLKIFSVCCVVYFSIFGLYYGYNYTRLILSNQYKDADTDVLSKQQLLTEKREELVKQNFTPDSQMDTTMKKNLADYDQLLKNTKTEAEYNFDDWYYKGVSAYNNNEFEKMIVYMQKALEKDSRAPLAPDAYLYLGLAYTGLKLYDKAIEANNTIVNNYKDYTYLYLAYYNNGVNFGSFGRYDKALEEYDKSIAINPNYALSYNNKGDTLLKLKRVNDALPLFEKAIELDPNSPFPWYNKSLVNALNADKENTLNCLKQVIDLDARYKITAKTDVSFKNFWDDDDFKKLVE